MENNSENEWKEQLRRLFNPDSNLEREVENVAVNVMENEMEQEYDQQMDNGGILDMNEQLEKEAKNHLDVQLDRELEINMTDPLESRGIQQPPKKENMMLQQEKKLYKTKDVLLSGGIEKEIKEEARNMLNLPLESELSKENNDGMLLQMKQESENQMYGYVVFGDRELSERTESYMLLQRQIPTENNKEKKEIEVEEVLVDTEEQIPPKKKKNEEALDIAVERELNENPTEERQGTIETEQYNESETEIQQQNSEEKSEMEMAEERELHNEDLEVAVVESVGEPLPEALDEDAERRRGENMIWMEKAFDCALLALSEGEAPIGCVFVYENNVISSGRNLVNKTKNATRHAEMVCLDDIFKWIEDRGLSASEVMENIIVYVTVEPCIMCAYALALQRVTRIFYGCKNMRFGGCGSVYDVRRHFPNTTFFYEGGICSERSIALLKAFYSGINPNAPISKRKKKKYQKKLNKEIDVK